MFLLPSGLCRCEIYFSLACFSCHRDFADARFNLLGMLLRLAIWALQVWGLSCLPSCSCHRSFCSCVFHFVSLTLILACFCCRRYLPNRSVSVAVLQNLFLFPVTCFYRLGLVVIPFATFYCLFYLRCYFPWAKFSVLRLGLSFAFSVMLSYVGLFLVFLLNISALLYFA